MFSDITWSQYILTIVFVLATYYTILIFLYFRGAVISLMRTQKLLPQIYNRGEQPERPDYHGLEEVVADLKSILESAGGAEKGAVLSRLKQRLDTYPGLRLPAFRVALFQFIIRNATQACSFTVTERELDILIPMASSGVAH